METAFTPFASLLGGALIGLSAVLFLLVEGRVAGITGIAAKVLGTGDPNLGRNLAFLVGLAAAPILVQVVAGPVEFGLAASVPVLVAGGLLVGFGSVIGSGCTSGHGVCGLARLSRRSVVAVATFMAAAMVTVYVVRHLG